MAYRFSNTEKWNDAWFIELSNDEKLLFNYLQDNVDNAGFLEISFRKLKFDLQMDEVKILGAIKGLYKGLIIFNEGLKNGDVIYLKNFLKHQKNYPLNPFNSFHNHALSIFKERLELVEKSPFISELKVVGTNKRTNEKIDENLLNHLNKNKGLGSPLVKGIVKGEGEVKGEFGKSENLLVTDPETFLNLNQLKTQIQNEFTWKETLHRNLKEAFPKIQFNEIDNWLETFFKKLENRDDDTKTLKDFKQHFSNWLEIELQKEPKKTNGSLAQKMKKEYGL